MKTTSIRIVSDGTNEGTYVETLDGVRLDNVVRVQWWTAPGAHVKAEIQFYDVETNLIATVNTPFTKKRKKS